MLAAFASSSRRLVRFGFEFCNLASGMRSAPMAKMSTPLTQWLKLAQGFLTAADGHGAKADAPPPNVQLLALGTQGNAELHLQRLTAEAGTGHPELGILDDLARSRAPAGSEDGAVRER